MQIHPRPVRPNFETLQGADSSGKNICKFIASGIRRSFGYLAKKARFVPVKDLPYYAGRYLWNPIYRLVSDEERLALYCPKLDKMDEILVRHPLDEVCAIQWRRCLEAAAESLAEIPNNRRIEISYENFVRNPENELKRVLDFLDMKADVRSFRNAVGE